MALLASERLELLTLAESKESISKVLSTVTVATLSIEHGSSHRAAMPLICNLWPGCRHVHWREEHVATIKSTVEMLATIELLVYPWRCQICADLGYPYHVPTIRYPFSTWLGASPQHWLALASIAEEVFRKAHLAPRDDSWRKDLHRLPSRKIAAADILGVEDQESSVLAVIGAADRINDQETNPKLHQDCGLRTKGPVLEARSLHEGASATKRTKESTAYYELPHIMFKKDALALCMFLIAMLLGTTTRAMINFSTTKPLASPSQGHHSPSLRTSSSTYASSERSSVTHSLHLNHGCEFCSKNRLLFGYLPRQIIEDLAMTEETSNPAPSKAAKDISCRTSSPTGLAISQDVKNLTNKLPSADGLASSTPSLMFMNRRGVHVSLRFVTMMVNRVPRSPPLYRSAVECMSTKTNPCDTALLVSETLRTSGQRSRTVVSADSLTMSNRYEMRKPTFHRFLRLPPELRDRIIDSHFEEFAMWDRHFTNQTPQPRTSYLSSDARRALPRSPLLCSPIKNLASLRLDFRDFSEFFGFFGSPHSPKTAYAASL
ncbi:hypothetical protein KCU65_g464, partial [Aureobasidium melanogenum]